MSLLIILNVVTVLCMDNNVPQTYRDGEVWESPQLQAPLPSPLPSPQKDYFVILEVDNRTQHVTIPTTLKKYFPDLVDIVDQLKPENNTLRYPELTKESTDLLLNLLNHQITQQEPQTPLELGALDKLIAVANTMDILHVKLLKKSITQSLLEKFDDLVPNAENKLALTQQFDTLRPFFINTIKKECLINFKKNVRDKNPFFETLIQKYAKIQQSSLAAARFSGNGAVFATVDKEGTLYIRDIDTPHVQTVNTQELNFANTENIFLSLNYTGSVIGLGGLSEKTGIVRRSTNEPKLTTLKLPNIDPENLIFNNAGTHCFVEYEHGYSLLQNDGTNRLLAIPDAMTSILSACFSRDDTYLFVLCYKEENDSTPLCVYSPIIGNLIAYEKLNNIELIAPGIEQNTLWLLNNKKKLSYVKCLMTPTQRNNLLIIEYEFSIPIESNNTLSLQANVNNSLVLISNMQDTELIDVPARATRCRYTNLKYPTFNASGNRIVALEQPTAFSAGNSRIIQFAPRPYSVKTTINELFDTLTITQLINLEEFIDQFDTNRNRPVQPLVAFINTLPEYLRQFVREYLFGNVLTASTENLESAEPPKKQQRRE